MIFYPDQIPAAPIPWHELRTTVVHLASRLEDRHPHRHRRHAPVPAGRTGH
ncbi:hypothetical protein [Actinocrispum sp. NPDC049592]|uniref:hypothetical protein n=1 Tax=Actinocrispum sp. NPDC049592 TaxID=3154835 RepID=UPI003426EE3D